MRKWLVALKKIIAAIIPLFGGKDGAAEPKPKKRDKPIRDDGAGQHPADEL